MLDLANTPDAFSRIKECASCKIPIEFEALKLPTAVLMKQIMTYVVGFLKYCSITCH